MSQLISFCINTARNERNHIELLFRSLRKNLSRNDHEIIVYVENDNQGTIEFLKTQKEFFPHLKIIVNTLPIPLGYARNINLMFEKATHEITSYIQSDMVIGPKYDEEILKYLTPDTIISATRIEPPLHPPSPEKITYDFGLDPSKFNLDSFTEFAEINKQTRQTSFFFAPFTLYKKQWLDIGGHDTLFRRSREDSDVLYRLVLNGVKIIQIWNANVYHFTCTSSRGPEWWTTSGTRRFELQRAADFVELFRFGRKWPLFKHPTKFDPDIDYKYHVSANITHIEEWEIRLMDNLKIRNFLSSQLPPDVNVATTSLLLLTKPFQKIYVDSPQKRNELRSDYSDLDRYANKLLDINGLEWEHYKKYYRILSPETIFPDFPVDDDIVLNIDFSKNQTAMWDASFLLNLNEKINKCYTESIPLGSYELEDFGNSILTINRWQDRIKENIVVTNPPIDESKLTFL